jgi:hypothetical protein
MRLLFAVVLTVIMGYVPDKSRSKAKEEASWNRFL